MDPALEPQDFFLVEFELGKSNFLNVTRFCLDFATFLGGLVRMLLFGVARLSVAVRRMPREPALRICSSLERLASATRLFNNVGRIFVGLSRLVDGVARMLAGVARMLLLSRFACLTGKFMPRAL